MMEVTVGIGAADLCCPKQPAYHCTLPETFFASLVDSTGAGFEPQLFALTSSPPLRPLNKNVLFDDNKVQTHNVRLTNEIMTTVPTTHFNLILTFSVCTFLCFEKNMSLPIANCLKNDNTFSTLKY